MDLTVFRLEELQHVVFISVPIRVTELYLLLASFYQSSIERHMSSHAPTNVFAEQMCCRANHTITSGAGPVPCINRACNKDPW